MYNLLISLAVASACFLIGWLVASSLIAGFVPAVLGFTIAYFLLGRRTLRELQTLMAQGQQIAAEGQSGARPTTQRQAEKMQRELVAKLKTAMEKGFELQKWQFGISAQIHAQLGSLDYMLQDYDSAKGHLEKADNWILRFQSWQPSVLLGLIEQRNKNVDAAIVQLEKGRRGGSRDPLYWAVYAYAAHKMGKSDVALPVINEGASQHKDSEHLKKFADQLRNKRALTPEIFGQAWLQFYPEDAQRIMAANPQMAADAQSGQPMSRAQRRAAARGKGGQPEAANGKFPHPRF
ncbi:MAG: tetratricopeptide (TPR) repeat protein [Myxococcota bacterium]|jgi:tetratricopeptide (TPR) repeat protein